MCGAVVVTPAVVPRAAAAKGGEGHELQLPTSTKFKRDGPAPTWIVEAGVAEVGQLGPAQEGRREHGAETEAEVLWADVHLRAPPLSCCPQSWCRRTASPASRSAGPGPAFCLGHLLRSKTACSQYASAGLRRHHPRGALLWCHKWRQAELGGGTQCSAMPKQRSLPHLACNSDLSAAGKSPKQRGLRSRR